MSRQQRAKSYDFLYSDSCNMCRSGAESQSFFGRRLDKRQGFWPKWKPGICIPIFKCNSCGLLYPNPMPVPRSLADHYDVNPEEYWKPEHFEKKLLLEHPLVKNFQRLYGPNFQGKKALDIGSGIGQWIHTFDQLGLETYGLEPSESFRNASIERNNVKPERIQLSSIEDATYPESSFAFINFRAVVEHLVDPAKVLEKVIHWLEPGGLIYVEVPSSSFLQSRLVRGFYRLTGAGEYVINLSPMHPPYHLYEFGLDSFLKHGKLAGYSVVSHQYTPCAYGLPKILKNMLNSVMRKTDTGMQLLVWLKKD